MTRLTREAEENQLAEEKQLVKKVKKVVATDVVKTIRVCGDQRHIVDLDSCNPQTGFPTKWMPDYLGYDSQVTVSDDKSNYTDNLEMGNVRAINIR